MPQNTKLFDCDTERIIKSGEKITLQTDDPLPSMELLEMQWILNRVKTISGAADIPTDELDPDRDFRFGKLTEEDLSDEDSSEGETPRKSESQRSPATMEENRRILPKSPKRQREREESEPLLYK